MKKKVSLLIFAGQSNMAGRGQFELAPKVETNRAFEFRVISDPTRLYPVEEPFGVNENNPNGIYEPDMKKGSMVSSFLNSFAPESDSDVVALSASKGGSIIVEWQPESAYYEDLLKRINKTKIWLQENNYCIENTLFLWLQGETDGDLGTTKEEYRELTSNFFACLLKKAVDEIFVLEIGNHRDDPNKYVPIRQAQQELGNIEHVTFVPTSLKKMAILKHMIDQFHYDQIAYNQLGNETAQFISNYTHLS